MKYASFGRRLVAYILDGIIVDVALVIVAFVLAGVGLAGGASPESIKHTTAIIGLLLGLTYATLFTGLLGQTPGKMALGIKVVGPGGGPPGIGRAFLREVIGKFLSGLILLLGYLWMLWDAKKQCWHDRLADTVVVLTEKADAQCCPSCQP
ncbi:MAG: RDD family protein [Bacillota bacterium]